MSCLYLRPKGRSFTQVVDNKEKSLSIKKISLDYLIQNSHLQQEDLSKLNILLYALLYDHQKDFGLTQETIKYLFDHITIKQKTYTFKLLIDFYQYSKNLKQNFLKEIEFLLLDCEYKPNYKIIQFLKQKELQKILVLIQFSKIFLKLKNQLNNKNNPTKIYKI